MKKYIFGLSSTKTRIWLLNKWEEYPTEDLDGFIDDILLNADSHIQPLLSENDEIAGILRNRYVNYLSQLIPKNELKRTIKSELKQVLGI